MEVQKIVRQKEAMPNGGEVGDMRNKRQEDDRKNHGDLKIDEDVICMRYSNPMTPEQREDDCSGTFEKDARSEVGAGSPMGATKQRLNFDSLSITDSSLSSCEYSETESEKEQMSLAAMVATLSKEARREDSRVAKGEQGGTRKELENSCFAPDYEAPWVPDDSKEPILRENEERFCLLPVKYNKAYEFYKMAQASYWTVEEVDLSQDKRDWERLTAEEKHFISYVLAFFAASDGIVLENLAIRFMQGMFICLFL